MRIELHGQVVGYEDTGGAKIPLVLIHGFPLDRTVWAAQVQGLACDARVVALDLCGFGESAASSDLAVTTAVSAATTTMDDYAKDVAELMDALQIGTAVIGGVSMGGYVAMAFRRLFPARLRGLVLVDTRGGPDSAEARKARDAASALARAEGSAAVAAPMLPKMLTPANAASNERLRRALETMMNAQSVDGIVGALAAIRDRPDSMLSLATGAVPTLVVCGADDLLIPTTESDALRDAIPGARLVRIPGAAHLPNFEQPDLFNAAVLEFLRAM